MTISWFLYTKISKNKDQDFFKKNKTIVKIFINKNKEVKDGRIRVGQGIGERRWGLYGLSAIQGQGGLGIDFSTKCSNHSYLNFTQKLRIKKFIWSH